MRSGVTYVPYYVPLCTEGTHYITHLVKTINLLTNPNNPLPDIGVPLEKRVYEIFFIKTEYSATDLKVLVLQTKNRFRKNKQDNSQKMTQY